MELQACTVVYNAFPSKTTYSRTSLSNHLILEGSPLLRAVLPKTSFIFPYIECLNKTTTS